MDDLFFDPVCPLSFTWIPPHVNGRSRQMCIYSVNKYRWADGSKRWTRRCLIGCLAHAYCDPASVFLLSWKSILLLQGYRYVRPRRLDGCAGWFTQQFNSLIMFDREAIITLFQVMCVSHSVRTDYIQAFWRIRTGWLGLDFWSRFL